MPSAQNLLKVLQDKDLLPHDALQTAQQLVATQPQMADGLALAMWLVQQQHLTANQAQRLLASLEETGSKTPPPPLGQPKPPQSPATQPSPTQAAPAQSSPTPPRPPVENKPAPAADEVDLGFAPLENEPGKKSEPATPATSSEKKPPKGNPPPGKPAASSAKQSEKTAKPEIEVGKGLDSPSAMKGPLDSLIDSELDAAADGPALSSALSSPPPSRKLKYRIRRFFNNIVKRYKSKTIRVQEADPRKVRLLLYSWGIAVALLVVGLFVFWMFSPRPANDVLRAAETAKAKEDFTDAIAQYDYYLKNYPKAEAAPDIALERQLTELRQASKDASASGDWSKAFEMATKFVNEKAKDRSFLEMQSEAGGVVGAVGIGLAQQSEAKPTTAVVDQAKRIAYMLQMNWSNETRPNNMIEEINRRLESGDRVVARRRDLKTCLALAKEAIDRGDLTPAYVARNQTVERFPELVDDPELAKLFDQVSESLRKEVHYTEKAEAASTDERASAVAGSVPLAVQPVQGVMADAQGQAIFVADGGAVFGLDAATGQVLWRRPLPQDPARVIAPLTLPQKIDGDAILTDTVNNELLRVEAKTGKLLWRQTLAAPLVAGPIVAVPVQDGNRLLVVTQDQKLVIVDLVRGNVRGVVELPQPVNLPPVVDPERGYVILTADAANMYVFAGTSCRQVLHLGHDPGTIAVPPVVIGNALVLAVNGKKKDATLHLLAMADADSSAAHSDATAAVKLVTRLKIKGQVNAPLQTVERGLLVVTAEGGLQQYSVNPKSDSPLALIDLREAPGETRLPRWPLVFHRRVWVADTQLAQYEAPADHGHITPNEVTDRGSVFLAAPAIIPGGMFHVRRRPGMPGAIVSAVDLVHQVPQWQTWLGAPLAGEPIVDDGKKLIAFTASGGMFRLSPADVVGMHAGPKAAITVESASLARPISNVTRLSHGMVALTSGSGAKQITLYDPQEQEHRFRTMVAPHEMSAAPAALDRGLLMPCLNGSVYISDYVTHVPLADAMPPPLEGLSNWAWQTPRQCGPRSVLLCDSDKRLLVVELVPPPAKQSPTDPDVGAELKVVHKATSEKALASPVAVLPHNAYVVDATGKVLAYSLPDLAPSERGSIQGKCVWGPRRAGKLVLLATDAQLLYAYDEEHEAWHVPLRYGVPIGDPLASADTLALSSAEGSVWQVAAGDGKESSRIDAGCRLSTGPIDVGGRLFVGSQDGTILQLR